MPTGLTFAVVMLVVGVMGFALIGYVHMHLAEGRRFREQAPGRKKAIVALGFAQWPYMFLAFYGLVEVVRCFL